MKAKVKVLTTKTETIDGQVVEVKVFSCPRKPRRPMTKARNFRLNGLADINMPVK